MTLTISSAEYKTNYYDSQSRSLTPVVYCADMFTAQESTNSDNDDCECGKGLMQPYLILGLIIWLVILTLVVLILLVIVTIRHKEFVKTRDQTRNWDALRDEKWREYTLSHDRMSDQLRH